MASKLTGADISEITRQSDVTSKPVRDNFTNLKNKTNELVDEIAAAAIGTTNAETTAARPYHTNLKERLDSVGTNQETLHPGRINYVESGGAVTVNGGDVTKVDITECYAKVQGIDVKIAAATSAAVAASAAGNHRVVIVVANSSNAFVLVQGAESLKANTDPVFPAIATTQCSLAAIYVDDGAVDNTGHIYTLKEDNYLPNYYIKQATTLEQGRYDLNNLIIDAATTFDCTGTSGFLRLQRNNVLINCRGYFHNTSAGDIGITSPHSIGTDANSGTNAVLTTKGDGGATGLIDITTKLRDYVSGVGGDGDTGQGSSVSTNNSRGGAGGGGGATIISAGGDGGDATQALAGGIIYATQGYAVNKKNIFLYIKAYNISLSGDIDFTGADGGNGSDAVATLGAGGGGGGGGAGGGHMALISNNDITINAGGSVDCSGGNGGDGGDSTTGSVNNCGGGGGGGGGGGMLLIRSKSYTNNGTVQSNAGIAGTGGAASGGSGTNAAGDNGSNGGVGVVDQAIYSDLSSSLTDGYLPLNFYGMD